MSKLMIGKKSKFHMQNLLYYYKTKLYILIISIRYIFHYSLGKFSCKLSGVKQ